MVISQEQPLTDEYITRFLGCYNQYYGAYVPYLVHWHITVTLGFIAIVVGFVCTIWMSKELPREVRQKYRFSTIFQSRVPFITRWRLHIDLEDVAAFERYRKRGSVFTILEFVILGPYATYWAYVRWLFHQCTG